MPDTGIIDQGASPQSGPAAAAGTGAVAAPAQAPSQPDMVITVDGVQETVPWEEALGLAQKGRHYTKSMQELGDLRRDYFQAQQELETQRQAILQERQQWEDYQREYADWYAKNYGPQGVQPPQQRYPQQPYAEPTGYEPGYQQPGYPQQPPYQGPPTYAPQFQPQMPRQGPSSQDELQELKVGMEQMKIQNELSALTREFPVLKQERWQVLLLQTLAASPATPMREIVQALAKEAEGERQQIIGDYLKEKQQAEAQRQALPAGPPVRVPPNVQPPPLDSPEMREFLRTHYSGA